MKKIITSLSSALLIFVASLSFTGIAKSAEFFTIGTGGPTGVYFQTGNAICKMLARLSFTDFDGQNFMDETKNTKKIDNDLIFNFAPKIAEGVEKLKKWSESV